MRKKARYTWAILLGIAWIFIGCFHINNTLEPTFATGKVEIEIPADTSVVGIGQILQDKGLIRDSTFFRLFALTNGLYNLKSGAYLIDLDEAPSLRSILKKIKNGEQDLVRVDIPEGWTIIEIANRLEHKGYDGKAFLKALEERQPVYKFEENLTSSRKYRLEGYLAADTYFFRKHEQPADIVKKMVDGFAARLKELDIEAKLQSRSYPIPMNLDQLITVASLIVREGGSYEQPNIAGVIYNRLSHSTEYLRRLSMCSTINYLMTVKNGRKCPSGDIAKNTNIQDPYNTYKNPGLPPGPISTVSKEALLAALEPAKHDNLYFVSKHKGSEEHYFAKTFAEHRKNIERSNTGTIR